MIEGRDASESASLHREEICFEALETGGNEKKKEKFDRGEGKMEDGKGARGCEGGARVKENLIFMKHFKVVPSVEWV